jgi:hypothetical protein
MAALWPLRRYDNDASRGRHKSHGVAGAYPQKTASLPGQPYPAFGLDDEPQNSVSWHTGTGNLDNEVLVGLVGHGSLGAPYGALATLRAYHIDGVGLKVYSRRKWLGD